MTARLPDVFDPRAFADKGRHLEGTLTLGELDRLTDLVCNPQSLVQVELQFGKAGGISCITGTVVARLELECQRCLESMFLPVHSELDLGVVSSVDEALLLPDSMEALIVGAGEDVAITDIVQDELLLAIPVIPQHPDCRLPTPPVAAAEAPHPFAKLAQLKSKPTS